LARVISIFVFWMSLFLVSNLFAEQQPYRVLLLISYHPEFPTFYDQIEGVRTGLVESGVPHDKLIVDVEFMDSKRFHTEEKISLFKKTLEYKLSRLPAYDVVVTSDDNATQFAVKNQASLLRNWPIVFLGVNNREFALSQNENSRVTGVIEEVSIDETIALISHIRPDTDLPTIISDATVSGQADLKTLLSRFPELSDRVLSLERLSHEQLLESLSKLPASANVLLLSAYRDFKGVTVDFDDHLSEIKHVLQAPIFHLWEHGLNDGVLAGVVISHHEQGRTAGHLAGEVLLGEDINEMHVVDKSPNIPMIDHALMEMYGVKISDLPTGVRIINRPPTVYDEYKYVIWFASSIIAFLIYITISQHRIMRIEEGAKLELENTVALRTMEIEETSKQLARNKAELQLVQDSVGEGLFGIDREGRTTFINPAAERITGWTPDDLIGQKQHGFLHHTRPDGEPYPEDENPIYSTIRDGKIREVDDDVFWRKDGSSFPVKYISSPMLENKEIVGAVVAFSDISVQKKSEEEIRRLAMTDPLTGLANRNQFHKRFEESLRLAQREEKLLALMIIERCCKRSRQQLSVCAEVLM